MTKREFINFSKPQFITEGELERNTKDARQIYLNLLGNDVSDHKRKHINMMGYDELVELIQHYKSK